MYTIEEKYFDTISSLSKNYFLYNLMKRADKMNKFSSSEEYKESISESDSSSLKFFNKYEHLPIVVLIGGVAKSGKSTFINYCKNYISGVYEESTIDPCKDVVSYMNKLESEYHSCGNLEYEIKEKTDKYRTLLSKMKELWCDIDDGPNEITCGEIRWILENGEHPAIIFINVREPKQIEHLKNKISNDLRCIVLTLAVVKYSEEQFSNESDNITLDYNYDTYIQNEDDLTNLDNCAREFCLSIIDTNNFIRNMELDIT